MTNWIRAALSLLKTDRAPTDWAWDARRAAYQAWDAYYDNTIYNTIVNGGQRDNINELLGNGRAIDLAGLYNPVARVVDLYGHVFGGDFGTDITTTADPALQSALDHIWQWSNMEIASQQITQLAPLHGACGLRIVARNDPDPARRRVYIKPEHPRAITDIDVDDRGNVQSILLEYDVPHGDLGEERTTITIRELLTKDEIATWRVEAGGIVPYCLVTMQDNGPYSRYENELGIVPYVLLSHSQRGGAFGTNAFYRETPAIDRYNALMTHINIQVHKHVNVVWLIAASGNPPTRIDLSGTSVIHINTTKDTPLPVMQPMVAPLDISQATAQARAILDNIEDALPELKATGGKFLAGQSGETIKQLRQPAEDRLRLARTNYEDALVRAQQIAVSWGIVMELWDVGTGSGTREAADRAYRSGAEDHRFNRRPLLPDPVSSPTNPPPPAAPAASQGA